MKLSRRACQAVVAAALLGVAGTVAMVRGRAISDPDAIAAEAHAALRSGRRDRAETLLARLARARPPTAHDLVLQAEMEEGRGRIDQAIRRLTEIPPSDPLAARARLRAGQLAKARDQARAMEDLFQEALRLDPRIAPAHRGLIYVYAMQGRRRELNAQYRALAALEPLTYEDVFLWTVSLDDVWLNDGIRETLERFLAADPDDRASRLALAAVLIRAGAPDVAETTLQRISDDGPDVLALRALLALEHGDLDRLGAILSRAPAEHPELSALRGKVALKAKAFTSAAEDFRRALRLDPTNREALQGLSQLLILQGRRDEARHYLKRIDLWRTLKELLEDARNGRAQHDRARLVKLAETCASLDRAAEAAGWYGLALELDPLDRDVQQALYRLRSRDTDR